MKIDRLILGTYQTNSYIVRTDAAATDCVIIDTGLDDKAIPDFLKQNNLRPTAVILTHSHIDHIFGIARLRADFPNIKVYMHSLAASAVTDAEKNLSANSGIPFASEPADFTFEDADSFEAAGIKLKVLHTPGHTAGGICLYCPEENIVFIGDTLFADSIGRTDLPGGSIAQLLGSIKNKLFTLPGQTICYPGHGEKTSIAHEIKFNPFFQQDR